MNETLTINEIQAALLAKGFSINHSFDIQPGILVLDKKIVGGQKIRVIITDSIKLCVFSSNMLTLHEASMNLEFPIAALVALVRAFIVRA